MDTLNMLQVIWGFLWNELLKKSPPRLRAKFSAKANHYEGLWPIISVDLDGVLLNYTGWKGFYVFAPPYPGALDFLRVLGRRYTIIVCTARPDWNIPQVEEWLESHGMMEWIHSVTNIKPPATVYIDDRALLFTGDYDEVLDKVDAFQAHWETRR